MTIIRQWVDPQGDTWYQVDKDAWTLFHPVNEIQPQNVTNCTAERMREAFPEFPF